MDEIGAVAALQRIANTVLLWTANERMPQLEPLVGGNCQRCVNYLIVLADDNGRPT